jgi:hypothetical protein
MSSARNGVDLADVTAPPNHLANSILSRLAYLVAPKPELPEALGLDAKRGHEICQPATVITPVRDYEDAFEGWKRAWMTKAKQDFIAGFAATWSGDFPGFTAQLDQPESFDRWWSISEIAVTEIDSAWTPS